MTLNLTKTSVVTFENLNSTEVDRQSPTGLIFIQYFGLVLGLKNLVLFTSLPHTSAKAADVAIIVIIKQNPPIRSNLNPNVTKIQITTKT